MPPTMKFNRAGLQFPVGRVDKWFRRRVGIQKRRKSRAPSMRLSVGASVYTAALLEYLVAEVLELSGNVAKDKKRKRIQPKDIMLAIFSDEELDSLVGTSRKCTIAGDGVIPHIHKVLIPKKKKKRSTAAAKRKGKSKALALPQPVHAPPTDSQMFAMVYYKALYELKQQRRPVIITHCITKPAFGSTKYHERMGYKSLESKGFYKAKFGTVMQDLKTRFQGHNIGHPSHSHVQVFTPEMLRVIAGKHPLRLIAALLNATCRIGGESAFPTTSDGNILLNKTTFDRLQRSILDESVWPYLFQRGGMDLERPTLKKVPEQRDWYEQNTLAHAFVAHVDNQMAQTEFKSFAGKPEEWAKHVKAFVFAFVTDYDDQDDVAACATEEDTPGQYAIVAGTSRKKEIMPSSKALNGSARREPSAVPNIQAARGAAPLEAARRHTAPAPLQVAV